MTSRTETQAGFVGRTSGSPKSGNSELSRERAHKIAIAHTHIPHGDTVRHVRMKWGLSSQLPRWRAFDGRRSRFASR